MEQEEINDRKKKLSAPGLHNKDKCQGEL